MRDDLPEEFRRCSDCGNLVDEFYALCDSLEQFRTPLDQGCYRARLVDGQPPNPPPAPDAKYMHCYDCGEPIVTPDLWSASIIGYHRPACLGCICKVRDHLEYVGYEVEVEDAAHRLLTLWNRYRSDQP